MLRDEIQSSVLERPIFELSKLKSFKTESVDVTVISTEVAVRLENSSEEFLGRGRKDVTELLRDFKL